MDIKQEIKRLHDAFHSLKSRLSRKLDTEKRDVADFRSTLLALPQDLNAIYLPVLKNEYEELRRSKSHEECFFILNSCWNFVDYDLLGFFIQEHGDNELQSALEEYVHVFNNFCKSTTVYQLVKLWKPRHNIAVDLERNKEFVLQLKQDPQNCTVETLDHLRRDCTLSLSKITLILCKVKTGSLTTVWLISSENVNLLSTSISELVTTSHADFLDRYQITFLSVDDYFLYPVTEVATNNYCATHHDALFLTINAAPRKILECLQRRRDPPGEKTPGT